jgi:hypothetical protein
LPKAYALGKFAIVRRVENLNFHDAGYFFIVACAYLKPTFVHQINVGLSIFLMIYYIVFTPETDE